MGLNEMLVGTVFQCAHNSRARFLVGLCPLYRSSGGAAIRFLVADHLGPGRVAMAEKRQRPTQGKHLTLIHWPRGMEDFWLMWQERGLDIRDPWFPCVSGGAVSRAHDMTVTNDVEPKVQQNPG